MALLAALEVCDVLFCRAAPALEAFVAACSELADAVAVCWVGAVWVTDCDRPPSEPLWVGVLVWLVPLSLLADAEAPFELIWSLDESDMSAQSGSGSSEAIAVPTWSVAPATSKVHASKAKQHRRGLPMGFTIRFLHVGR